MFLFSNLKLEYPTINNNLTMEGKESNCIICYKSQANESSLKLNATESELQSKNEISEQLKVIFIVRNLLKVPSSICEEFLKDNGSPCSWIKTCSDCSILVDDAFSVNCQINTLRKQIEKLSQKFRNEIKDTFNGNASKSSGKRRYRNSITHSIRNWVFKDVNSGQENDEKTEKEFNAFNNPPPPKRIKKSKRSSLLIEDIKTLSSLEEQLKKEEPAWIEEVSIKQEIIVEEDCESFNLQDNTAVGFLEISTESGDEKKEASPPSIRRSLRFSSRNKAKSEAQLTCEVSKPEIKFPEDVEDPNDLTTEGNEYASEDQHYLEDDDDGSADDNQDSDSDSSDSDSDYSEDNQRSKNTSKNIFLQPVGRKPKEFPCDVCDTEFNNRYRLRAHRKHKHGITAEAEAKAEELKMLEEFNLAGEISDSTIKEGSIQSEGNEVLVINTKQRKRRDPKNCTLCDQEFESYPLLVEHRREAHNLVKRGVKPPLSDECEVCGKKFNNFKRLCVHRARVHNIRKYVIDTIVTDKHPWKCFECKLGFEVGSEAERDEHELQKHSHSAEIDKHLFCLMCDKRYRVKSDLCLHYDLEHKNNSQKEKGGPYRCELCEEEFTAKTKLRSHIYNAHTKEDGTKPIRSIKESRRKKLYKCTECDLKPCSRTYLRLHMQKHTKERLYLCDICSKRFSSSVYLNTHKLREHSDNLESNPLRCNVENCNKIFSTVFYLRDHIKTIHQKVFSHVCEVCGYGCQHLSLLKTHMISHDKNPPKPHKCTYEGCNAEFKMKNNLNMHIQNMHTKDKKWKCKFCTKGFATSHDHKRHEKAVHSGVNSFKCELCDRGFPVRDYLVNHMKHKHKQNISKPMIRRQGQVFVENQSCSSDSNNERLNVETGIMTNNDPILELEIPTTTSNNTNSVVIPIKQAHSDLFFPGVETIATNSVVVSPHFNLSNNEEVNNHSSYFNLV